LHFGGLYFRDMSYVLTLFIACFVSQWWDSVWQRRMEVKGVGTRLWIDENGREVTVVLDDGEEARYWKAS
jgi:hypothetical protein